MRIIRRTAVAIVAAGLLLGLTVAPATATLLPPHPIYLPWEPPFIRLPAPPEPLAPPAPAYATAVVTHACVGLNFYFYISTPNGPVPPGTTWQVHKGDPVKIQLGVTQSGWAMTNQTLDLTTVRLTAPQGIPQGQTVALHTYGYSVPMNGLETTSLWVDGSQYAGSDSKTWRSNPCGWN